VRFFIFTNKFVLTLIAVTLPVGVRLAVSERMPTTEVQTTFLTLREDFDFVGICSETIELGLLYPRGPHMFVCVANVGTLVDSEFPFLTCKQLAALCSAHSILHNARDKCALLQDSL
jgi:hypothetical protein